MIGIHANLFAFIWFGILCNSSTWIFVSLPRLGKLSSHYFITHAFCPFFFPLLLRVLDANVSTLDVVLQSLKLLPFLLSSFFFCCSHWVLCTTLSSRSPIDSYHFLCCLFPIAYFLFQFLYFSALTGFFFCFQSPCWHLLFLHSPPNFTERAYDYYFELFIR